MQQKIAVGWALLIIALILDILCTEGRSMLWTAGGMVGVSVIGSMLMDRVRKFEDTDKPKETKPNWKS